MARKKIERCSTYCPVCDAMRNLAEECEKEAER